MYIYIHPSNSEIKRVSDRNRSGQRYGRTIRYRPKKRDRSIERDPRNDRSSERSRRNDRSSEQNLPKKRICIDTSSRNVYNPPIYQPFVYNAIPKTSNITRHISIPYDPESPPYPPPSPVSTKYSRILRCNCYYSNTRLRWYYQDRFGNSIWCTTNVNNELNSS